MVIMRWRPLLRSRPMWELTVLQELLVGVRGRGEKGKGGEGRKREDGRKKIRGKWVREVVMW